MLAIIIRVSLNMATETGEVEEVERPSITFLGIYE